MYECIDHVQVCCPPGGEETAQHFYGSVLELEAVEKAPEMAERPGSWFRVGATGLHIGVMEPFEPARKAHPALRLSSHEALDRLRVRLEEFGCTVTDAVPPVAEARCKTHDPFGNVLEFVVGTTG